MDGDSASRDDVCLVEFLTKNETPGTNSCLVLISILVLLYFLGTPGGASERPAGRPTPQSVAKALRCVRSIVVWRATSKNQQHDWLRRMVNIGHTSHYTSSSSSAHNSLPTHAMRKRKALSYSSCSPLSVCMHCMSWSKRSAEKVDRMVKILCRLAIQISWRLLRPSQTRTHREGTPSQGGSFGSESFVCITRIG